MKYQLTPQLLTLTYEAALKSFWRKNALKKFLRSCGINEKHLNTWDEDETKRTFLDRTFDLLQRDDKGKKVILEMAVALSEQVSFPDLRNWEDSNEKILAAEIAVDELKQYLQQQNKAIKNEEEKAAARKKAHTEKIRIQRQLTDKENLRHRLDELFPSVGTQQGGYQFQDWFFDLLDFCEIDNKRPYNSSGRQIDGTLTHDGTTYLIELKFTGEQSSVTDIDSLKGKIDKKADNTMGILVSISGYSSRAVEEASGSKTTILLMDHSHLYYYLSGGMDFKDIVSRIRRHASQTGESFLKVEDFGK
jgi:hypothetical protein